MTSAPERARGYRLGRAAAPLLGAGALIAIGLALPAAAQQLNGRPGVEYYPPWMLDADPRVTGGGQDYRIWDDRRFDRRDQEFLDFQRRQRQELGPGYTNSPEYRDELRQFDERRSNRGTAGGSEPAPIQDRPR